MMLNVVTKVITNNITKLVFNQKKIDKREC